MTDKTYPDMPGWKGKIDTGRKAAFAIADDLGRRHKQVFTALAQRGEVGATPCNIADMLELPIDLVRPRFTELHNKGRIYRVGKRMGGRGLEVMAYSIIKPAAESAAA